MPFKVVSVALNEEDALTQPIYWSGHWPGGVSELTSSKKNKENDSNQATTKKPKKNTLLAKKSPLIKHPFLLQCAQYVSDDKNRVVFENMAHGNIPPGFAVKTRGNCRISARVRKNTFSSTVPSNPEDAAAVILKFMAQHGNFDDAAVAADSSSLKATTTKNQKKKSTPFRRSLSHRKPFRLLQLEKFFERQRQELNLTDEQVKSLKMVVYTGFAFQQIQCKHLIIDDQTLSISGIQGLKMDQTGHFTLYRKNSGRSSIKKKLPSKKPIKHAASAANNSKKKHLKKEQQESKFSFTYTGALRALKNSHLETIKNLDHPLPLPEDGKLPVIDFLMCCDF
jgi:hypothetical protein